MPWPIRIALARLRPFNIGTVVKLSVVTLIFCSFLVFDFVIFRRLFRAAAKIEEMTPFFALGLIQNFLELVFLTALSVLFFSSLTTSIGAFFADADLEIYHSTPLRKGRLLLSRWAKAYIQSAYVVIAFIGPLFFAMASQYDLPLAFAVRGIGNLVVLLAIPVCIAATVIILLVRFFPVRRVQQIAASIAILFLSVVVIGIRVARPERLFTDVGTDDVADVLRQLQLPAADRFPSSWLAEFVVNVPQGLPTLGSELKIAATAALSLVLFFIVTRPVYFRAFVRSREDNAPAAIGARAVTSLLDRITAHFSPVLRALLRKEARVLTRDAAQWSQVMMMIALLFIYLYNIQMMPLKGDARAVLLAYLNVGMAGFVISAICLRFAFPSVSAEGRAFWVLQTAPVSFRKLLYVKLFVFTMPLLFVTLLLVTLANVLLHAKGEVWLYTISGSLVMTVTLVALGVALGALAPDFKRESPMEVALSLGGFTYMALSLMYVGLMLFLFARPTQRFFFRVGLGIDLESNWVTGITPVATGLALSFLLVVGSIEVAHRRLAARI